MISFVKTIIVRFGCSYNHFHNILAGRIAISKISGKEKKKKHNNNKTTLNSMKMNTKRNMDKKNVLPKPYHHQQLNQAVNYLTRRLHANIFHALKQTLLTHKMNWIQKTVRLPTLPTDWWQLQTDDRWRCRIFPGQSKRYLGSL